jgi:hypothetical protein
LVYSKRRVSRHPVWKLELPSRGAQHQILSYQVHNAVLCLKVDHHLYPLLFFFFFWLLIATAQIRSHAAFLTAQVSRLKLSKSISLLCSMNQAMCSASTRAPESQARFSVKLLLSRGRANSTTNRSIHLSKSCGCWFLELAKRHIS